MKITGEPKTNTVPYSQFGNYENQEITVTGTVHNIRMMSDFAFVPAHGARNHPMRLCGILFRLSYAGRA